MPRAGAAGGAPSATIEQAFEDVSVPVVGGWGAPVKPPRRRSPLVLEVVLHLVGSPPASPPQHCHSDLFASEPPYSLPVLAFSRKRALGAVRVCVCVCVCARVLAACLFGNRPHRSQAAWEGGLGLPEVRRVCWLPEPGRPTCGQVEEPGWKGTISFPSLCWKNKKCGIIFRAV